MADVLKKDQFYVTLRVRVPLPLYDRFAGSFTTEGYALAALRQAIPGLLSDLAQQRKTSPEAAARERERSSRPRTAEKAVDDRRGW